jgi:hypothetical protein
MNEPICPVVFSDAARTTDYAQPDDEIDARIDRLARTELSGETGARGLYQRRPVAAGRIAYAEPAPPPPPPILIALCAPAMGSGKSEVARRLVERHGFMALKFAGTLKEMLRAMLRSLAYPVEMIERMVEGDLKEIVTDSLPMRMPPCVVSRMIEAMVRAMLNDLAFDERTIDRMLHGDLANQEIDGLGVTPRYIICSLNKWIVDQVLGRTGLTSRYLQQTLGTEWGRELVRPDLWIAIMRLKIDAWRIIGGGRDIVIDDMRFANEFDLVCELGGVPAKIRPGFDAPPRGHASEGALDDVPMDTLPNSSSLENLAALTDGFVEIVRARAAAVG